MKTNQFSYLECVARLAPIQRFPLYSEFLRISGFGTRIFHKYIFYIARLSPKVDISGHFRTDHLHPSHLTLQPTRSGQSGHLWTKTANRVSTNDGPPVGFNDVTLSHLTFLTMRRRFTYSTIQQFNESRFDGFPLQPITLQPIQNETFRT